MGYHTYISHTVFRDDILNRLPDGADAEASMSSYVHALLDAIEAEYPEAHVVVVECRNCDDRVNYPKLTSIQSTNQVDSDGIASRIESLAQTLYTGNAWSVYRLNAA